MIVIGCEPSEIAWDESQISENTKAYIGPLFKGIFTKLAHLEHIYISSLEGKIVRSELIIGGKTAQELESELRGQGINISGYVLLDRPDFKTSENTEQIDLVRLRVSDLGLASRPTTAQIYAKIRELGLELCPAEVGPRQRLEDMSQLPGGWYLIGMEQIADQMAIRMSLA